MKILYGIQGTGNGHIARARALVPYMREAGLEIDFLFTGRNRENYFDMELFGEFVSLPGLSLVIEDGQLNTFKTITRNKIGKFISDIWQLKLDAYDLVVSDFEPVTAWAAKLRGIPSIGISHQCAFDYVIPKVRGYLAARFLLKTFAPTKIRIGLHWHHFNQTILPPMIEPIKTRRINGSKIVVYMAFEELAKVVEFLLPFTDYTFQVYADIREKQDLGHIKLNPLSYSEFHHDLEDAFGVITNAGFELASECLTLGKKLLVRPLAGQYEQQCNALALQALNRGTIIDKLDQDVLGQWLKLSSSNSINYPNVAQAIASWLAAGQNCSLAELSEQLWRNVDYSDGCDCRVARSILVGIQS